MALIVQKYGGTSVGSAERIQAVAHRVVETVKAGNELVVVVSAMGKTTDGLVKLATELSDNPSRREMDMLLATGEQVTIALLSIAIQELGQPAISLTGAQVGIVTEAEHTRARILEVNPDRVERHLKEGKVVVVAGFQGVSGTIDREITTLGRGGSDTSAVALAAALRASACEIYTDVPGILTTDPRLVSAAQLLTEITADEMLELASLGAKVLHPRAVEIARNYGVPLVVRSSWTDEPGTWVVSPTPQPRPLTGLEIARPVDAVEFAANQSKIAILRVPDRAGIAGQFFGAMAHESVDVDLIVQSIHEGNTNDIAFTVNQQMTKRVQAVVEAVAPVLYDRSNPSNTEVFVASEIAKVSISGAGMIGRPGVAAQMFKTLADAGVNIQMISTSEIKVSCVIPDRDCDRAIAALCQEFKVSTSHTELAPAPPSTAPPVRGVALDLNQARLAVRQVPDRPGLAAELFGLLAAHNISVDTIIQSQRTAIVNGIPTRDIACTVVQGDAADAKRVLAASVAKLGCGEVLVDETIAKVSVVGA
ncbi:MAG: hypothetical protein RLZZ135_2367, partial [Cyanobacteriota bacterium]